jgi:hypothetical protein
MPAWTLWFVLVALLLLPVLLRLHVGDEPAGNEVTHEQGDEEKRDPDGLLAAA